MRPIVTGDLVARDRRHLEHQSCTALRDLLLENTTVIADAARGPEAIRPLRYDVRPRLAGIASLLHYLPCRTFCRVRARGATIVG